MLETPKSAKTPSTPGISNSCTTSAILENDDSTSFTVVPNLYSRSAANASACASRSRLINLPDLSFAAMAAEWPPAPSVASMYVPSGFTSSHSSTSSSITGVCGADSLPTSASPISNCTYSGHTSTVTRCTRFAPVPQLKLLYLAPTLLAQTALLVRPGPIYIPNELKSSSVNG